MADLSHWLMVSGKVLLAVLVTLPLAINREQHTRIMGLRTFPLVAAGTCAYGLIAIEFIGDASPEAHARIVQGILSGIGFVGGGAIIKDSDRVRGTACAASIWAVGAVGIAIAYGNYPIAVTLTAVCFVILSFFTPLKKSLHSSGSSSGSGEKSQGEDDES